ncbi:hypothetical protein NLM27_41760 [Bradyrhizobium sp. CCGB12]|uniref:hypothetical protein n=1 Tax=Bradyrhizobium sp. CCGB12 TaxID=2949632 RepID=UPI0020B1EBD4|nr:hypothetical protein [Bradyrhizobium sp. CCGB12]MCP3395261.1 hypothetical protein [Bradyrhizobium sp. CCGB12]
MAALLDRADDAISESKRLVQQNQANIAECRHWLRHFSWMINHLKSRQRPKS